MSHSEISHPLNRNLRLNKLYFKIPIALNVTLYEQTQTHIQDENKLTHRLFTA
jgi:hypothetical protein